MRSPERNILTHAGVFLGYTMLTLLFTYPAVMHLGEHLIGRGDDLWIFQWNNWWVRKAWSQGLDVYHTRYMFHPQGVPLYFHSFSWFNTLLWLLLEPLNGQLTAYNLTVLLVYVLRGYAMYCLATEITDSQPASVLSGIVFAFFSRHRDINHPHLLSTQWIPLVALYLIRLAKTGRLVYGIWAGLALALCGLCGWQLLILVSLLCIFWWAYSLLAENWDMPLRTTIGMLLAFGTCVFIIAPLLWPVVNEGLLHGSARLTTGASAEHGTDIITYFFPNRDHPLAKLKPFEHVYQELVRVQDASNFPGYAVIGLILWTVAKKGKKARFWVLVALVFSILSLGSVLEINGRSYSSVPTPYRLLDVTILGKILRHPVRLNIMVSLAIAVISAIGAADLLERVGRARWRYVLTACLAGVTFLEYAALPFPTSSPIHSGFFEQLRQDTGRFAVADFPIGYLAHDKWYMYAQTMHERPMVGGHVSRVPEQAHDFINGVPLLETARSFSPAEGALNDVSRQLKPLAQVGVRYVLIHKHRTRPGEENGWRKWFAIPPCYEDDYLLVYRTEPRYAQGFQLAGEVGDSIGVISATLSTHAVAQEGLLRTGIVWGTREAPQYDWLAYLALVDEEGQEVQMAAFPPCPGWPTSQWGSDAVARGWGELRVDPFIERDKYTVTVGLMDPGSNTREGTPVGVGQVEVQAIRRTFEVPEMERETNIIFGRDLKLLGYDLQVTDDELRLTVHWQALRQMDRSYKFFVRLVDADTGELLAQVDRIPHDWSYPTIWWKAEEIVTDTMMLPVTDARLTECRLEVGVYDSGSGQRLSMSGEHRAQGPSDRFIVPEIGIDH